MQNKLIADIPHICQNSKVNGEDKLARYLEGSERVNKELYKGMETVGTPDIMIK